MNKLDLNLLSNP